MLDLMRRKKRLKVVLWLVIFGLSIGMLLFFVPGQNMGVGGFDTTAATVDGHDISMKDYSDTYRRYIESYSAGGKNRLDPEMIKALGLGRQALDSLISVRVIDIAARRLGLGATPQEIRETIEANPAFQDRGTFIGAERYKAILGANNISVAQFEEGVHQMLVQRKLRNLIANGYDASEQELREEYSRGSMEAQVQYVTLKLDDFKKRVRAGEADLRAYFEAHKDKYKTGEQRRSQYLLLSLNALASTIQVSQKDLEDAWAKQGQEEMVDASHILFELKEPAKEAEVQARAESVLKRARAGEDFAGLAKQFSDDSGSKEQGGNLGAFQRGRMIKEFEDAAFSLQPGSISNLVRTQYGFHIIKVNSHIKPTLDSMRQSLERSVQINRATEILKSKAIEVQKLAETQKDFGALAKSIGVPTEIMETPMVARDADPFAAGISQGLLEEVFRLKEIGEIGKAAEHPMGYALPRLLEVRQAKPPDFAESRTRVEADFIDATAAELLQAEARKIAEEAGKSGDLEKTARQYGLAAKTPAAFKRDGTADSEIGSSPPFNSAAFELPVGGVSQPIALDGGKRLALLRVQSRTPFDEAAFAKQKGEIRERMLGMWRDTYFQEYVRRVTEELEKAGKIRINPDAMEQVAQARSYY